MKTRAPRNRTLYCTEQERRDLSGRLLTLDRSARVEEIENRVIHQNFFEIAEFLPHRFIDLLILDPPYNLSKQFNGNRFQAKDRDDYQAWFNSGIDLLTPLLKPNATVYVCSDWKTSIDIVPVLEKRFSIQNRITWEREKGRGAKRNWKNNTEDIWFCTASEDYVFNVDDVKLKRRVIAPYRTEDRSPKDWEESSEGNFRLTHPSNIWTDITVPFWSMPENTDHPTQKPEKLIAKLVLASSNPGDFVFDPFMGSGTSAVVAKKLGRRFAGVELDREYCLWALKRLALAEIDPTIQGYADGVFWERNTLNEQPKNDSVKKELQETFL